MGIRAVLWFAREQQGVPPGIAGPVEILFSVIANVEQLVRLHSHLIRGELEKSAVGLLESGFAGYEQPTKP